MPEYSSSLPEVLWRLRGATACPVEIYMAMAGASRPEQRVGEGVLDEHASGQRPGELGHLRDRCALDDYAGLRSGDGRDGRGGLRGDRAGAVRLLSHGARAAAWGAGPARPGARLVVRAGRPGGG